MITTVNLEFSVSGQKITAGQDMPYLLASNTVNYVKVHFSLDEDWQSVETVSAVWSGVIGCYSTVLDGDGNCFVPQEILARKQRVYVNLVGSDVDNDEVVDRITTYPVNAINVNATAYTCGSETVPLTPSQFEQFIAQVAELVGSVRDIDRIELNDDYTLTVYFSDGTSWTSTSIRGEQGETGNGIASAVLNDDYTLTLTFTDGTSYTTSSIRGAQGEQGEPGEVTLAQLESVLPTDTASGAIASFPDGSDLFDYLSCICDINPLQDLHGYDKPWVGGAGKNKFDESLMKDQAAWNNITLTLKPNTTYVMSTNMPLQASTDGLYCYFNVTSSTYLVYDGHAPAVTTGDDGTLTVHQRRASGNDSFANYHWQIEEGSTATTFTPFANICPISGRDSVGVVDCGKNLFSGTVYKSGYGILAGGTESAIPQFNIWSEHLPIGTYTLSLHVLAVAPTIRIHGYIGGVWQKQIAYGSFSSNSNATLTFTISDYFDEIRFSMPNATYGEKFQVETGSTASDYQTYNGTTTTIPLGTTVYGGDVEVVEGKLFKTEEWGNITFDGSDDEGWYSVTTSETKNRALTTILEGEVPTGNYSWDLLGNYITATGSAQSMPPIWEACFNISGHLLVGIPTTITTLSEWKTYLSNNPLQICYKKATPTPVSITPTQISILKGQNNIFSDGEINVTYKADTQLWVEKKLAE